MKSNTDIKTIKNIKDDEEKRIMDFILELLSTSERSISAICVKNPDLGVSHEIVYRWLRSDKNGFREKYLEALRCQAYLHVDNIVEIADDSFNDYDEDEKGNVRFNPEAVARAKLRIETRKWKAERLLNKVYGQKINKEHSGAIGVHEVSLKELA